MGASKTKGYISVKTALFGVSITAADRCWNKVIQDLYLHQSVAL